MDRSGVERVVVIGGGYAGTIAANRLGAETGVEVTMINPRPDFVERIRLHQAAARSGDALADYADLLRPAVRLVIDTVTDIDTGARTVTLASGGELPYDRLVYAVGSAADTRQASGIDGAAEYGFRVDNWESAQRLRDRLDQQSAQAPVIVVGGGLTGIEMAAELGEQGRSVQLLCTAFGPDVSARGRRAIRRTLEAVGVRIVEHARVSRIEAESITYRVGTDAPLAAPCAVAIVAVGFSMPDLAARSGLAVDRDGRLRTDETLTSVDDVRIVGVGDAVAPGGHPLRMSCQAAIPLGAQGANTVLARIAGREPAPIDQGFVGRCISLGRTAGLFDVAHRDDDPAGVVVSGRAGAVVKERVCRGTLWSLRWESRHSGSRLWLSAGRRGRRARAIAAVDSVTDAAS